MVKNDFFNIINDFFIKTNYAWNHDDWLELLKTLHEHGYKVNHEELGAILERERETHYKKIEEKASKQGKKGEDELKKLAHELMEREISLDEKEKKFKEWEAELKMEKNRLAEDKEALDNEMELHKATDMILDHKKKEIEFLDNELMKQTVTLNKKEVELQSYERKLSTLREDILSKEVDMIKERKEVEMIKLEIIKRDEAYEELVKNLRERLDDIRFQSEKLGDMEQILLMKLDMVEKRYLTKEKKIEEDMNPKQPKKKTASEKIKKATKNPEAKKETKKKKAAKKKAKETKKKTVNAAEPLPSQPEKEQEKKNSTSPKAKKPAKKKTIPKERKDLQYI